MQLKSNKMSRSRGGWTPLNLQHHSLIRERAMSLPHFIGRGLTEQERDAFGYWLSGFVDGEGCFMLVDYYIGKTLAINSRFVITLRKDDLPILKKIRDFFGRGTIRCNLRVRSKPQAVFHIQDAIDLKQAVIPVFDRYHLRAKKSRDFTIWRRAVELLAEIRSRKWVMIRSKSNARYGGSLPKWTPEETKILLNWCSQLRDIRTYRDPDDPCYIDKVESKPRNRREQYKKKSTENTLFPDGKW